MPDHKATVKIQLGRNVKDYLDVIDRNLDYKRSTVRITGKKDTITIEIVAEDPRALMASLNGALKQLRIVISVDADISK